MPNFIEQTRRFGEVPALLISSTDARSAAQRGTVLLFHGLSANKEVQRNEAEALAARGFLTVTIDAVGHGERRHPDFDERMSGERGRPSYFEMVEQTARDIPRLIEALKNDDLVHPGRLGACGISMGGAVLFGAILNGCRFDTAATIVATPVWHTRADSPHLHPDRFFPTALLMQVGEKDAVVSPNDARALFESLRPLYSSAPDRLAFHEFAGEPHMFAPKTWETSFTEVADWFSRLLA